MTSKFTYDFLDPDWEDQTPVQIEAATPVRAAQAMYKHYYLEPAPAMYSELIRERRAHAPGDYKPPLGSIGNTRIVRFIVTNAHSGKKWAIYFR